MQTVAFTAQNYLSHINEMENARMSQLVFKMRFLLQYCNDNGINSAFTDNLRECVRLTQDVSIEKDIDGYTPLARDVAHYLDLAYKALHAEVKHRLPYDRYEVFMTMCRGWGALMDSHVMMNWHKLTEEQYTTATPSPQHPTQQAGGGGAAETRGPDRMQELLAQLRKLLEEYEA